MTPDVNVLVAAARSDHPHHGLARRRLQEALAAPDAVCTLMPMVLASFLSVVTSHRIFLNPTPIDDAINFLDSLLSLPSVQLAELGPEWTRFRQLCLEKRLAANDLPDAWLAAAVSQRGEVLITFDKGFRRLLGRAQLSVLTPE